MHIHTACGGSRAHPRRREARPCTLGRGCHHHKERHGDVRRVDSREGARLPSRRTATSITAASGRSLRWSASSVDSEPGPLDESSLCTAAVLVVLCSLEETSFLSALLKKHVGTLKVDHHYHGYPLSSFLSSRSSQYTADRRAATTTPLLEQAAFIQIPQQQGFVHFCPSTGRAHDRRSFVRLSGLGR